MRTTIHSRPGSATPKVLAVCQVFYPDAQSTSQLMSQLLRTMSVRGLVNCTVLCGYPSANREAGSGRVPQVETIDGVRIERHGLQVDVKAGMIFRLIAYASFVLHVGWRLLRADCRSILFGVTNPPFTGVLLWAISVLRRIPYQYMLLDVYPEGLVATGKLRERSLVNRIWMSFNRRAYQRASRLIVLGRDMTTLLLRNHGVQPNKIEYIPHWSVTQVEEPPRFEGNSFAEERGLADKFVVQYSGNMGLWHDIDTFARAAAKLRDIPDIRFLFIGGGMRKKQAQKLADELHADNITWAAFVPKEQLEQSLACCHVSLVSLNKGLEGIAVPCKIYGILASARPMIAMAPQESEVGLVVAEENCGIILQPGDVDGLVNAILQLHQNRELTATMSANSLRAYRQKYTLELAVEAFRKLWSAKAPAGAP